MTLQFPPTKYEIVTPRLVVRNAIEQDAQSIIDLMSKVENLPAGETEGLTGQTIESMVARIGRWNKTAAEGKNAFLSIALRDTNQVVGYMGYNCFRSKEEFDGTIPERDVPLPGVEGRYLTDLGVTIDYRERRKGYSSEVICACIEFAFEAIGCKVVRLETSPTNEPWRAHMRALGLGDLEEYGALSYAHSVGWLWKVNEDTWQNAKEGLKAQGKWPL